MPLQRTGIYLVIKDHQPLHVQHYKIVKYYSIRNSRDHACVGSRMHFGALSPIA